MIVIETFNMHGPCGCWQAILSQRSLTSRFTMLRWALAVSDYILFNCDVSYHSNIPNGAHNLMNSTTFIVVVIIFLWLLFFFLHISYDCQWYYYLNRKTCLRNNCWLSQIIFLLMDFYSLCHLFSLFLSLHFEKKKK